MGYNRRGPLLAGDRCRAGWPRPAACRAGRASSNRRATCRANRRRWRRCRRSGSAPGDTPENARPFWAARAREISVRGRRGTTPRRGRGRAQRARAGRRRWLRKRARAGAGLSWKAESGERKAERRKRGPNGGATCRGLLRSRAIWRCVSPRRWFWRGWRIPMLRGGARRAHEDPKSRGAPPRERPTRCTALVPRVGCPCGPGCGSCA
jgi:hypothetical protein